MTRRRSGVFGKNPTPDAPYGCVGGGLLPWRGVTSPRIIAGSSLAKGFGVPLAVLSGSERVIRRFEVCGDTRVHSSPPSIANLRAAEHALAVNRLQGDGVRFYLSQLVERFRSGLRQIGLAAQGGLFPVQMLAVAGVDARTLHLRLMCAGIRTVLVRCCRGVGMRLGFLITALHRPSDIDRALEALHRAADRTLLARTT